jgi:DUF1707 SHOCT-like domain
VADDAGVGLPRASDTDREDASRVLRDAHASGMLTVPELTQRLDAVYGARTLQELERVTGDLPVNQAQERVPAAVTPARRRRFALGLIGGPTIRGRFRAARRMLILSLIGGGDLDLSSAEIDDRGVTITAVSLIGGGDIYVPARFQVDIRGVSLVGGGGERGPADAEVSPAGLVRVRYLSLIGGPDVHPHQGTDAPPSLETDRRLSTTERPRRNELPPPR